MGVDDKNILRSNERVRPVEIWGGVTDPSKHDPKSYRYLIYAFNPMARAFVASFAASSEKQGFFKSSETEGNQSVDLFREPERLAERVSLSMSLIDQDHTGTWGGIGLVVAAPRGNVMSTSTSDSGTSNSDRAYLKSQLRINPIMSGDSLLGGTSPGSYNEVAALGTEEGQELVLKGFFIKVGFDGAPLQMSLANTMRTQAERLGLPVVEIQDPNPYGEDKLVETTDILQVYLGGKSFTLRSVYPQNNFTSWDGKLRTKFMSPEELQRINEYLKNNQGVDQERLDEILKDYDEAKKLKEKPKITFGDAGRVTSIKKRVGYGSSEQELRIYSDGTTDSQNVDQEMERMNASMLGGTSSWAGYNHLSPDQVYKMVQEAIEGLADSEAEKIKEWYESIKTKVDELWKTRSSKSPYYISGMGSFGTVPKTDSNLLRYIVTPKKEE